MVRSSELNQRTAHTLLRDEFSDRLSEAKEGWSSDRIQLDRRLLIVERVSEDVLERVRTSNNAMENFFASSPQVKRFEAAALKTENLQDEIAGLKSESREQVRRRSKCAMCVCMHWLVCVRMPVFALVRLL